MNDSYSPQPSYTLDVSLSLIPSSSTTMNHVPDSSSHLPIRVAVVGVGLIGPRHARTVVNAGRDVVLCAIVDPAPAGKSLAEELGVLHFGSVEEMLQSLTEERQPDAAIICTPNHTHVSVTKELSSAGIHVLVEKPISSDIPSGQELLAHLQSLPNHGVKVLVGHHRRFNPYMVAAKRVLSSGRLGSLLAINGLWTIYKPAEYFIPPIEWHASKAGGVVLINMVHEVDLLHFLFGPISRVHAEKITSQRGHEAEEGAALTFRFRSGLVGTFLLSDHTPSPYNFESGTGENPLIPKTGQDFYRVFGTDGSLSVPDMTIWSYGKSEPPDQETSHKSKSWHSPLLQETMPITESIPFVQQLEHFVRVIHGEEEPSCTAQAGLAALVVCQSIRDALEGNTTVEIEEYEL
ncbi:hypothetical protein F4810DRAFT_669416 [Camillea tinctor]|nr:hypothetical protein F4810DRAFT_669416 [Camillea tinctor]